MKRTKTILLTAAALLLAVSWVLGQEAVVSGGVTKQMSNFAGSGQVQPPVRHGFGFDSSDISGFPNRSASLTGGGAYDLAGFVHSSGGFRCTSDIAAGPFAGCRAGEGVRWDTVAVLDSTPFQCTGTDPGGNKMAVTDDNTVVLMADFYRAGDGIDESFTAKMFVSAVDEASDLPGDQKVWIQGIGCGDGVTSFSIVPSH